jgi:hypothetical protein
MEYPLADAAKLAKVNRSTLFRAIKSGKLSARRDGDGTYKVDASELARVYELQHVPHRSDDALHSAAQGTGAGVELALFRAQVLEEQLAREREERARERSRWDQERDTILERERDTVSDLRKRLDRAEERVLALSAPPSQPPMPATALAEPVASVPPVAPKPSPSFLARLFGRG